MHLYISHHQYVSIDDDHQVLVYAAKCNAYISLRYAARVSPLLGLCYGEEEGSLYAPPQGIMQYSIIIYLYILIPIFPPLPSRITNISVETCRVVLLSSLSR